jgi:hypothetical protein
VFGPARASRQSPSLSPYGAGQETPRVPRLTSASAQAACAAQLGASPVSPSAIYSTPSATLSRGGTMSPSPLPRTPPPADVGDGSWRDPTEFAVSLGEDANWLRHVSAGIMDDLSQNEMHRIAEGVADLLRAALDAGVWAWPSAELNQALSQLPSVTGSQGPSGTGGDVDMEGTQPPPPPSHNCGRPPFGGRPLPRPPMGGRGGSSKGKGRAMGPAPPINFSTRPAPPKGTYAQTARFQGGIPSTSVDGIVRLAKAFPELPTRQLEVMQQAGAPKKKPKASATVHGPSRRQVLITVGPPAVNPNCGALLERICTQLALHHSTLVVESATITRDGFAVSTGGVATESDLLRVREGARLAFPECSHVNAALLSSTSFLKLSDVPFLKPMGQGFVNVTSEDVMAQIAKAGLSSLVVLSAPFFLINDLLRGAQSQSVANYTKESTAYGYIRVRLEGKLPP